MPVEKFNIWKNATMGEVYFLYRALLILWAVHRRSNSEMVRRAIAGLAPVIAKISKKQKLDICRKYDRRIAKWRNRHRHLVTARSLVGAGALLVFVVYILNYLEV